MNVSGWRNLRKNRREGFGVGECCGYVWGIGVGIDWVVEGEVEMSYGLEVKSEEGEEFKTEGKEKEWRYRREESQDEASKVGEEEVGEWQTYCIVD